MKELQVTNGRTRTCFGMQLREVDSPFIVLIQYGRERPLIILRAYLDFKRRRLPSFWSSTNRSLTFGTFGMTFCDGVVGDHDSFWDVSGICEALDSIHRGNAKFCR